MKDSYQREITYAEHCQTSVRNRSCRKCRCDNVLESWAGYRNNHCQILQNSPLLKAAESIRKCLTLQSERQPLFMVQPRKLKAARLNRNNFNALWENDQSCLLVSKNSSASSVCSRDSDKRQVQVLPQWWGETGWNCCVTSEAELAKWIKNCNYDSSLLKYCSQLMVKGRVLKHC